MTRLRFIGVMILPSLGGILFCVGVSILIQIIGTLSYNARTGFLYELLFGPNSSAELIQTTRGTVDAIYNTVFGSSLLNKLVFFAFWCLVGLVVYFLLSGIGRTTSTLAETGTRLLYFRARRAQFEEQLGLRLIVSSITLLIGFIYSVFFIRTLFPFALLCSRIGLSSLGSIGGWGFVMASLVVLSISLHIFIVLLRFLLLRPRLYGGLDDVLDSQLDSMHELDEA